MASGVRWRGRSETSLALFGLAVLLAVVGVVTGQKQGPGWLLYGASLTAAVGAVLLAWMKDRGKQRDAQAQVLQAGAQVATGDGRWPLVQDVTLAALGVHRSHIQVEYLSRDREQEVEAHVRAGRPVLVVGPSMAGKTRMAAEVLRRVHPRARILIPRPGPGLRDLLSAGARPRGVVVWFNDLERYLSGDGLRLEHLNELLQHDCVVVATIRASEHERYRPGEGSRPAEAELLERFETVRLIPDQGEREALAGRVDDRMVAEGIRRYGVGTYVGAGYLAVERLETGYSEHPLGAAMVHAAVDWRRAGLDTIPASALAALAPAYLDPGSHHAVEDPTAALAWATARIDATIQLLQPQTDTSDADRAETYRAFDYIVDHRSNSQPIPDATWSAVEAAATLTDAITIANTAVEADKPDLGRRLLTKVVNQRAPDDRAALVARHLLASMRGDAGDFAGAVDAFSALLPDLIEIAGPDDSLTLAARFYLAHWRGMAGDPAGAAS